MLHTSRTWQIGRRLVVAALGATVILSVVQPEVAAAETVDQHVTMDVSLDASGTSTIDGFDPALGTLTEVALTIDVGVLVQECVENNQEVGAAASGTASGSLTVELPAGANSTVATADAVLPTGDLASSDGSDDCAGGFATDAGQFPAPVSSPDVAYAEQTDQASTTATLTAAGELAPFIGSATVAIAHTPTSDTELAVPAAWDAVSVATGTYDVTVIYTYTPTAGAASGPSGLSRTGASVLDEVALAAGLVLVGAAVVVVARRRERGGSRS